MKSLLAWQYEVCLPLFWRHLSKQGFLARKRGNSGDTTFSNIKREVFLYKALWCRKSLQRDKNTLKWLLRIKTCTSLKTCQYFLLERCWNLLSCESAKTFIIITKIYYKFHCNMGLISHLFIIPSITFLCATTTCLKVFLSQMSSNALIQSPN